MFSMDSRRSAQAALYKDRGLHFGFKHNKLHAGFDAPKTRDLLQSADGRFIATEERAGESSELVRIYSNGQQLNWNRVIDLWKKDGEFGIFYSSVLASSSFASFYWECPPVSKKLLMQPFEHRTVEARSGFRPADPKDFAEHFARASGTATTFLNLRGDAHLVVPLPRRNGQHYGHMAAFVRNAAEHELQGVWALLGSTMDKVLYERLSGHTWLNTHGGGVPWLHLRLDSLPKYYSTDEYKSVGLGGASNSSRSGGWQHQTEDPMPMTLVGSGTSSILEYSSRRPDGFSEPSRSRRALRPPAQGGSMRSVSQDGTRNPFESNFGGRSSSRRERQGSIDGTLWPANQHQRRSCLGMSTTENQWLSSCFGMK